VKTSRRIARVVVAASALLLVLGLVAGVWILGSASGARFLVGRVAPLVDGLRIEGVSGTVTQGLQIEQLDFTNDALDLALRQARFGVQLRSLLLGPPIRITEIAAGELSLRLKPADPDSGAEESASVDLPAISIERVAVSNLRIEPAEGEAILVDRLAGGVALEGPRIAISALDVAGPTGAASGTLGLDLSRRLPLADARLDVTFNESAERTWRARLESTPASEALIARVDVLSPIEATVRLRHDGDRSFSAELDLPRQPGDSLGLAGEILASLKATSDDAGFRLGGQVEAAGQIVAIDEARIARADDRLTVETFDLDWRDHGVVAIEGQIPLYDSAEWALVVATEGLLLPRGDGGTLTASGRALVSGARREPVLAPALSLVSEDLPPGALSGTLALRDGVAHADGLALTLARGSATIDGPIAAREPHVLRLRVDDFDPGLLVADWPGRLSGEVRFEGQRGEQGLDGRLLLDGLSGELRGRAIRGEGVVDLVANVPETGSVRVDAGRARLRVGFAAGGRMDGNLSAPDLSDLWPELGGNLDISWKRDGDDRVDMRAEALRFGTFSVDTLSAQAQVRAGDAGPLALMLDGAGVAANGRRFETIRLSVDGTRKRHAATLATDGALTTALRLEGGMVESGWRGRLMALDLDGIAALEAPADLSYLEQRLQLGTTCVAGAIGRACVDVAGSAGEGALSARLDDLDLGEVQRMAELGSAATLSGRAAGTAELTWRDGQPVAGEVVLRSGAGRVLLEDRGDAELGWDDLSLEAVLDSGRGTVSGTVRLVPDGELTLDGSFALDAPEGFAYDIDVELAVRELGVIEAFTSAVVDPEGDLSGQFKLRGVAGAPPDISGALALTGFTAQMPDQAIRIRDGVLVLAGVPDRLVVRGSVRSGDGVIAVDGRIDVNDRVPVEFTLRGEDFRAFNSPTLMVRVSPDLTLAKRDQRWNLDGRLSVPRARIDLERLEGSVSPSPDVVVIDDPVVPAPARPWRARIAVEVGDDVRLSGFGFDGTLAGRLDVRQRQGSRATATGQLNVTGNYEAFGQRLQISEGHLRFAGSPLDEPTLDLRAERKVRGQTVALSVTGNATAPTARVIPAAGMSEQDALAMLVTGRPLNRTGSGDRDALAGASSALGVIGGDLLAGKLRGSLGLDELGVSDDAGLDGEAFTIGKFLSPRLFVGYGIGLMKSGEVFTARFLLTDRLDVEASAGETQRAAINYRIER
jgi:translocation and assembly module TamB